MCWGDTGGNKGEEKVNRGWAPNCVGLVFVLECGLKVSDQQRKRWLAPFLFQLRGWVACNLV